ncbi:MAG: nucleoside recognition protein [Clostridiaceae bacterium]|nr:nucleoside recognition protein [Clostridiaceae bacterium]
MLNYIWAAMILIAFTVAAFMGRIEQTTQAALDSAGAAVEMSIGLLGVMCLWTGIMNVAEKSGLVNKISKAIRPVIRFLFPEIPSDSPAAGAIVLNMVANILGLGNAATPLGLKAIKELQKLNRYKDTASNAMCMFVVINTASLQLIPATVIAIRASAGSANPFEIIVPVWFSCICTLIVGISAAKVLQKTGNNLKGCSSGRRYYNGQRRWFLWK